MCDVPVAEAINGEAVLPERVQEGLGQLVGAAKEGLLALSVEVGLGVLRNLLEEEVDGWQPRTSSAARSSPATPPRA